MLQRRVLKYTSVSPGYAVKVLAKNILIFVPIYRMF